MTEAQINDDDIRELQIEAGSHGDNEMAAICEKALWSEDPGVAANNRAVCQAVIAETRANAEE